MTERTYYGFSITSNPEAIAAAIYARVFCFYVQGVSTFTPEYAHVSAMEVIKKFDSVYEAELKKIYEEGKKCE